METAGDGILGYMDHWSDSVSRLIFLCIWEAFIYFLEINAYTLFFLPPLSQIL